MSTVRNYINREQFHKLLAKQAKVKARGRRPQHTPGAMNRLEAEYGQYLDLEKTAGRIIAWRFEPLKLRLANKTYLTVDFLVQLPDGLIQFHEIKAGKRIRKTTSDESELRRTVPLVEDDAAVKLKVAAEQHDMFPFFLVWKDEHGGWVKKEC